jgi:hypothetical protein
MISEGSQHPGHDFPSIEAHCDDVAGQLHTRLLAAVCNPATKASAQPRQAGTPFAGNVAEERSVWVDLAEAIVALVVFVCFPFAVIAAAAALLALFDHIIHPHKHHHHPHPAR